MAFGAAVIFEEKAIGTEIAGGNGNKGPGKSSFIIRIKRIKTEG
jgi:hypothetical protein